ncbi:SWIM zinc finger family protein, partial [Bacillus subtilis]|uniref:SWIM zinc finger family protein n=1 Tax=Bacillus subtilis TaxID=1423 RepID=UPI003F7BEE39
MDETGEIEAYCNCPAYGNYYDYCKHVAAVLLAINERGEEELGGHAANNKADKKQAKKTEEGKRKGITQSSHG